MSFEAINLTITAVVGLAAWQYGWKPLALAESRQELFRLRDELFLEASSGEHGLSLELPAYRSVREQFHSHIRYRHRMSLPLLMMVSAALRERHSFSPSTAACAVKQLPEGSSARRRLEHYQNAQVLGTVKYIFKISPTCICMLALIIPPVAVYMLFRHGLRGVYDSSKSWLTKAAEPPVDALVNSTVALA